MRISQKKSRYLLGRATKTKMLIPIISQNLPKIPEFLRPLSVARFQTFANNSLYLTRRSRLRDELSISLAGESELIRNKQSTRHNRYSDLKKGSKLCLDIISDLQQTKKAPLQFDSARKKTVFGARARRTLLEAGAVVDANCGKNSIAITLTLPGSSRGAVDALANYSSYILNRLLQVPRRSEIPIYIFSVWELQARGALHLHISLSAKPSEMKIDELLIFAHKVKDTWYKVLLEMIGTKEIKRGNYKGNLPGVDMFEKRGSTTLRHNTWRYSPEVWRKGWDIQIIEKSVAQYFSKYASKQALAGNGFKIQKALLPLRWWSCNQVIRKEILKVRYDYTVNYHSTDTDKIVNNILEIYPPTLIYTFSFNIENHLYKTTEIGDDTYIDTNSHITNTIVNGYTTIYYWKPEIFKEVNRLIRELKPTLSQITYER